MDTKQRLSALEVALNNEMREREFYLKHAKRTINPVGKGMFQQIGDEELEHYERLSQLYQKWEKQEKWPDTIPLMVKGTIVKDVLAGLVKKVDEIPEGNEDDLDAIRTAINFEAEGVKYYAKLGDMVSDPKEKQFFGLLAQIENEHYLSLKDTEEYLTDPTSWHQRVEHHSLDGG